MDFVNDNLQILATLGSALAVYIFLRIAASKDVRALKEELKGEFRDVKGDIREIKQDVKSINQRLTRLEGRFEERGYWESRKRTGTDGE